MKTRKVEMLFKCCCFGTKVTPVDEEIMTISLCDSKNNNFVDKVTTQVPEPSKTNSHCFRCCFWRRTKNEVIHLPPVQSKAPKSDERDRENGLKPVLARQSRYPTAHTKGTAPSVPPTTYPAQPQRFVSPVPSPVPSPITPLAPSPSSIVPAPSSQSLQVEDLSGDNTSEELRSRPSSELRLAEPSVSTDQVDTLTVQEERLSTPPPPATPPPPLAAAETEPETQSEELVDDKPVSGQTKFGKNTGKPRLRGKGGLREANSEAPASPKAPPFDNPKDALNRSLQQLEHPEWEVTIQGLQSLVRLSRHHTALLPPVLHQVVMALTKHVRNLRSQVARVACKAATYLFTSLGRGMENEMDELCAVLFNRTADTNKFLRADCNTALDAMVDHVSANKAVAIVVNKGAKHQNAVVRTAACRLLLRLCTRLGPERTLNLPRDTRDAILNTAARSLTEGSLDTRRLAKEMFVLLGRDSRLPTLLTQVVPASVMRSISKVLARLTAQ